MEQYKAITDMTKAQIMRWPGEHGIEEDGLMSIDEKNIEKKEKKKINN